MLDALSAAVRDARDKVVPVKNKPTREHAAKLMYRALEGYLLGESLPMWKAREAIDAYRRSTPEVPPGQIPEHI